jgi:D-alanine-D-alanine ligase
VTVARKLRVGILFGGRSGEHEVSLRSARSILDALDPARYEPVLLGIDHDGRWHLGDAGRALLEAPGRPLELDAAAPALAVAPGAGAALVPVEAAAAPEVGSIDVFFPVLHGTYGEDGTVQGLLELAGAPYVGSGVLGSAVGMDKDVTKRLLRDAGLPIVEYLVLRAGQPLDVERIEAELGFPCFVKPANLGSSVGVHKVAEPGGLVAAIADALRYDRKVIIERGVDAREIECSVLGNDAPRASVLGEIAPKGEFYSYAAKYLDEDGAALIVPAELPDGLANEMRDLAVRAFEVLELAGLARVDFLLERPTGRAYINEVNTIPGFTSISMYPKLWEASGLGYPELISELIELALDRHRHRTALTTRYE